jgi:hypothetical protein
VTSGRDDSHREQSGQADVVAFGSPRQPRFRWLSRLALAGVVAASVILAVARSGGHHQPSPPPAIAVTDIGHAILGVRSGWQLVALGQRALVSVQFATGRITHTALPPLQSDGPVSLIVESHRVIVRPLDNVPGYLVPDGQPARSLGGILANGALLLPGPRPDEVWDLRPAQPISLVGPEGTLLPARLAAMSRRFPPQSAMADGRGGVLLFDDTGRQYDTGPGLLRPVGPLLLAVGPRAWLAVACNQDGSSCQNVVIAAGTGAARALPGAAVSLVSWQWPGHPGAVAPNGSTAALFDEGRDGTAALELVNLATGAVRPVAVNVLPSSSSQTMAWSPDSRWLFVLTAGGRLAAVSPATGRVQELGLGLTGLIQVAIRPAAR